MKPLLPYLLLLAPIVAAGQSTPAPASSPPTGAAPSAASDAPTRMLPLESSPTLEGSVSFRSLYYLFNRSAWPTLPLDGTPLRSGSAVINLADPLQIIVLFNGWHLPYTRGTEDIRLADLRTYVLRSSLVFTSDWPDYASPGFIVLIQKRDHEWALVARLSNHYLVEDRSGIGVCAIPVP